jgi:hypothetical protein
MMDEISKTYIVIEVDDHESSISENVDNALIESIWEDLDGHVDREYIRPGGQSKISACYHQDLQTDIHPALCFG